MPGPVLVAGALHLDVVVRAPRLPRLDETLMGEAVDYRLGGKGGNQAVAAARMGARVMMAGSVGPDDFGRRILASLDRHGVDAGPVTVRDGASGMSVAIVEASGEYGAVVVSGVNRLTTADEIALPDDCAVLCLQNEIPQTVNAALARRARAAGARVIFNAAPARPDSVGVMALADIVVVNRGEAETFWNGLPERMPEGPEHLIVTLGREGLVWLRRGAAPRAVPALPVDAVSAHGAGDVFVGALAAELAAGAGMEAALDMARAAAALFVSRPDADRMALEPAAARALLSAQSARR